MTTPTGKERRRAVSPATVLGINNQNTSLAHSKRKPNRHTVHLRRYNQPELTKAEMQADLKKAVENTK